MLWDKFENYLIKKKCRIYKNSNVVDIKKSRDTFEISYLVNEEIETINKNILFSNPLLDLIKIYDSDIPSTVIELQKN